MHLGQNQGRPRVPGHGRVIAVLGPFAFSGDRDGYGLDGAARVKVHLHPCAGPGHLMPVDSAVERRALVQLPRLQDWSGQRRDVGVTIEKALFDVGFATEPTSADPSATDDGGVEDDGTQALLERLEP